MAPYEESEFCLTEIDITHLRSFQLTRCWPLFTRCNAFKTQNLAAKVRLNPGNSRGFLENFWTIGKYPIGHTLVLYSVTHTPLSRLIYQ